MRIGIFTETYRPTINGVVVSIETFRAELEQRGHQYFIFAPLNKHEQKRPVNVHRFPSIHFHNDPIYPLALPMPPSLAREHFPLEIIRGLDIIHIQHFAMMGQYGLTFAKQFGIPSVYTYHTMAELYTSYIPVIGELFDGPIRALTRYTTARANCVLAPTVSVRDYLRSIGVSQPITVVPTGIHTARYQRTNQEYVRIKYHIPPKQSILLYVGRIAAEKNIQFLLDAFRLVLKQQPQTHLLLVGSGPDKGKVRRWIRKNQLDHNVTCTGFLEREETIKVFGTGDLFVFPSVSDTQGIVIIEAMAAGTVPVAIDRLGPHDLIKNGVTGYLTDLNKAAFAAKIVDLLVNPEKRARFAKAAQEKAVRFDAAKTALGLEKVYETLLSHPRSQPHT